MNVDCAFFLRGLCNKGSFCPFKHDPSKIAGVRQEQSQIDCIFFKQGRCSKGSLCPFRHDSAKLPPNLQEGSQSQAHQPPSVTVDFGSPEGRQQPQPPPMPVPVAAAPAPAPKTAPIAGRPQPAAPKAVGAAMPAPRQQQQQGRPQQSTAVQKSVPKAPAAEPRSAPAAAAAPGGIPARLAGRLGPASAAHTERLDTMQQAGKRPEREPDSDSGRAPRRRAGGALGFAISALHDVLGADVPLEPAAAKGPGRPANNVSVRKRRLGSDSEEQSGQEEGEQGARQKQPAAKRAAGGGAARPRAVPAPATAEAQPDISAPKSIEEIRKERQQRFAPLSGSKPAGTGEPASSTKSARRKHAPIVFQPEAAAAAASPPSPAGIAAALPKQPLRQLPTASAAEPAAKPAAAAPNQRLQQPQPEKKPAVAAKPASQPKPAAVPAAQPKPAAKPAEDEVLELDLDFDGMEEGGEEALGANAGGDDDDFEAQMRALEEGL